MLPGGAEPEFSGTLDLGTTTRDPPILHRIDLSAQAAQNRASPREYKWLLTTDL
jgi:hypothetical protein